MNIRARLAKLEKVVSDDPAAKDLEVVNRMSDAELCAAIDEQLIDAKEAVHYVMSHPNGCFSPPISFGRTVEEITLSEIVNFENVPFARVDDEHRSLAVEMVRQGAGCSAMELVGYDLTPGVNIPSVGVSGILCKRGVS